MYKYAITDPINPPSNIPQYIPNSPILNTNPSIYEKINTSINSLKSVNMNDVVPFPTPWNTFPADAPNGTYNMNRHINCKNPAMSGANCALDSEYENITAICDAKKYNNAHTIIEEINPTLTAYLIVTLRFSYFLEP